MTPTQRTLKLLREQGYLAQVVEHWNPHARIRQDLFGFADVFAVLPPWELDDAPGCALLVQCTSEGVAARVRKVLASQEARACVAAGLRVEVWGWSQRRSKARRKDGGRSKAREVRLRVVAFEAKVDGSGTVGHLEVAGPITI